ncbi:MAG: putative toxin-antitoxin system toxin component, PIN family [Cyanobacteria bacterium P01_H01_bin.35]
MSREKIIIDTNVFISAALNSKGTPRMALNLAIEKFDIFQSEETYLELSTRLGKSKFDRYISSSDRLIFLDAIKTQSIFIDVKHRATICVDTDDNKFLELAFSGNARYLITGDKDLLVLENYYQK